jgi:hypothetical protein
MVLGEGGGKDGFCGGWFCGGRVCEGDSLWGGLLSQEKM